MPGRLAGSWALRLAVTAGILGWMATRIDMGAAARAVGAISRVHLAAVLGLVAIDRLVMILRWVLLLRAAGVGVSARDAARIFLTSSFVGSFLPAGVGGDAARAWSLAQVTSRLGDALASVLVDRLLGVVALAAMGGVGLAVWAPDGVSVPRLAAGIAVAGLTCAAAFWADAILRALVPADRHGGAIVRRALRVADAVAHYRGHRSALTVVMGWSIVVQVLRIVQAYLLGLGLGLTV
ncbi:MAG: lysylphosphatidylglycerol synthase transmembrane domain-containing protein, partial [Vicinamibacterales bacterium]